MDPIYGTFFVRSAFTPVKSSKERSLLTCRSCSRPNSSSSSTRKQRDCSALRCPPHCNCLPTRSLNETARVHHAARRRGGGVAAHGARAADGDAGDRLLQCRIGRTVAAADRGVPRGSEGIGLCRRPECGGRNTLGRRG